MKKIFLIFFLTFSLFLSAQQTYYVTPTGLAGNSGASFATPKSLQNALSIASAGDSIILKSGTYLIPRTEGVKNTINLAQSGTSSAYITVCAEPNTIATIDFQFPEFKWVQDSYGFYLTGSYWKLKNIKITRAGYQGIYITGGYNILDYCIFYDNRNSGIEVNKGGHHTTLLNCDCYHNYDPKKGGSMADGFAIKQTMGPGNVLIGCRAWDNSDDGYDTFDSPEFVVFRNCWCFSNGINSWSDPNIAFSGNGNGFKVGGNGALQNNILSHCVAFGHPSKGFDQNNNTGGITMYNCTSYKNSINYGMGGTLASGQKHTFKNCVSLSSTNANSYGTGSVQTNNTWNSGISVSTADFLSLVLTQADDARNPDGSLPDNDLFRLKTTSALVDAGVNVGLPYNGSAPDIGAFETGGIAPTLTTPANKTQTVVSGTAISSIVFTWGGGATDVNVSELPLGLTANKDVATKTLTISGSPTTTRSYTVTTVGGSGAAVIVGGTITASTPPVNATISLTSGATTTAQTVTVGTAIAPINYTYTGNFTSIVWTGTASSSTSPTGISVMAAAGAVSISGTPSEAGVYGYTININGINGGSATTATGTITVLALAPTLTNPVNKSQTVISGTAITPIIFTWGGGATNVTVSALPATITATPNLGAKTLTLTGTPLTEGVINYTVTTVGGSGVAVSQSGSITVQAAMSCLELVTIPIVGLATTGNYSMVLFNGATQIKVLGEGEFSAGNSDFLFSKAGIPSGSYTYKLMNGATVVKTGTVVVP
jgi:hypothetical protein